MKVFEQVLGIIVLSELFYHLLFFIGIGIASFISLEFLFDDMTRALFEERSDSAGFGRFCYLFLRVPIYMLIHEMSVKFKFKIWSK